MANVRDIFQYNSTLRQRHIRVLFIRHSAGDVYAPLEVWLEEQCLDNADFHAMSYVWGDSSKKKRIYCDGKGLDIGQNLYEALVEHRRRGTRHGLWVDAICINQGCTIERTEQVRLMGNIYSRASGTTIWLGDGARGDEEAIHLAHSIYSSRPKHIHRPMEDPTQGEDLNCKDCDFQISPKAGNPILRGVPSSICSRIQSFEPTWDIQNWCCQKTLCFGEAAKASVSVLIWTAFVQAGARWNINSYFARAFCLWQFYRPRNGALLYYETGRNENGKVLLRVNLANSMATKATDPTRQEFSRSSVYLQIYRNASSIIPAPSNEWPPKSGSWR